MKVKDVMSKTVDSVGVHDSVENISRIIFGRGINGVPVCDKNDKVVGFITERDILNQFYPSVEEYMEDTVNEGNFDLMEEKISHIFSLHAGEIMSKNPVTITSSSHLLKAQSLMFIHKIGRLPVVDEKKHLIGMVSKGDVFRSLVGGRLSAVEDEEYNDWLSKHYPFFVDWKKRLVTEIPALDKIFKQNKINGILDVGCGTGEHTIALAKKGYVVWGFERSRLMIKDAKENLSQTNLPPRSKEQKMFYHGEYEDALKKLKGEFQAAIFMGGSLAYNPDTYQQILSKTAKFLPQKSIMIFQIPNFEKILKIKNRISFSEFKKTTGNTEHAFYEFYNEPDEKKRLLKTFSIFDFDGKTWKFYGLKSTQLAYLTQDKIESMLKKLGYETKFFGSNFNNDNWDKIFYHPFEVSKSDWLNVVAVRK